MATIVLRESERAVVWVNGAAVQVLGVGRHRLPLRRPGRSVRVQRVDLRLHWLVIPGQELSAADIPGVRVSVAAQWRVADPLAFLDVAAEPIEGLRLALQLVARDLVASRELAVLVAERAALAAELHDRVAADAIELGIDVVRAELRDVSPPGEVRRAALAVHTARQDGLAALERARGETAALRALANGARVLTEHPALLQLRTAQTAAFSGGTVVLGVPQTGPQPGTTASQ